MSFIGKLVLEKKLLFKHRLNKYVGHFLKSFILSRFKIKIIDLIKAYNNVIADVLI